MPACKELGKTIAMELDIGNVFMQHLLSFLLSMVLVTAIRLSFIKISLVLNTALSGLMYMQVILEQVCNLNVNVN